MGKFREPSAPPPLSKNELQELNRTVKSGTGRRLLWEIHRIRSILLRAHELEIFVIHILFTSLKFLLAR